ncbi:hypothetical protein [Serratia liquefaciens]|uniref:hypothetical protein n=1 Tax=Serratia liquefaciens TaxID=614 RepID=UPI00163D9DD3|nr:hypothetical protein [Serratia liquefaciens]
MELLSYLLQCLANETAGNILKGWSNAKWGFTAFLLLKALHRLNAIVLDKYWLGVEAGIFHVCIPMTGYAYNDTPEQKTRKINSPQKQNNGENFSTN